MHKCRQCQVTVYYKKFTAKLNRICGAVCQGRCSNYSKCLGMVEEAGIYREKGQEGTT